MSNCIPYEYPNYSSSSTSIYSPYNMFYIQLSKEISDFSMTVIYHKQLLNKTRKDTITRITTLITNSLQKDYSIEINFYGSYATDFSIESSDIDILIGFKPIDPVMESKTENILLQLSKAFIDEKDCFSKVEPICTASVPIIKLECNILKSLDSETTASIRQSYAFNFEEIFTIKFDITFAQMNPLKEHPTLKEVEFIKETAVIFPQLKQLLFVLKRYLKIQKLNSCFHGGLSSFSLFFLLIAFIKIRNGRATGSGEILFDFFDFYSKLDFSHYTINVNLDNPYVYHSEDSISPISILDPFTLLNVAKSSFLVREIKSSFLKALNYLMKFYYSECNSEKTYILNGLFSI